MWGFRQHRRSSGSTLHSQFSIFNSQFLILDSRFSTLNFNHALLERIPEIAPHTLAGERLGEIRHITLHLRQILLRLLLAKFKIHHIYRALGSPHHPVRAIPMLPVFTQNNHRTLIQHSHHIIEPGSHPLVIQSITQKRLAALGILLRKISIHHRPAHRTM